MMENHSDKHRGNGDPVKGLDIPWELQARELPPPENREKNNINSRRAEWGAEAQPRNKSPQMLKD